ncbi:uncharacterized protein M421DRAFT_177741 [Didymella exigua CBS 183.55]|uniref:Uncharacterized protein n=1 Tax=Didymella exigua CBS 183.55 TaxID=1150837 RepID=A0A6A5RPB9_9PLEO|nr:uncharacterized protein M421DRAFT_177741 [Didymella exigua CBS 183.55]KAF1927357.1 hypothetical protein M421DRAFT_177741 [Didymella exigua CBS 183.55]
MLDSALSLFMLRVSRAVVVVCTNCGEMKVQSLRGARACEMFNDAPSGSGRLRQVTEIVFALAQNGPQRLRHLKHSASLGLTTVDAA